LVPDTILDIIAQGAWNGGRLVDNSIYENKGMTFKGGIPVNHQTIEERIGVRTRIAAAEDERIGVLAFKDLLQNSDIDPARIKLVIGQPILVKTNSTRDPLSGILFNWFKVIARMRWCSIYMPAARALMPQLRWSLCCLWPVF